MDHTRPPMHRRRQTASTSSGSSTPPSSPSASDSSPSKQDDMQLTPTRRNKRKMTEPRKRTDFSIKRLCSHIQTAPEAAAPAEEEPVVIPSPQSSPPDLSARIQPQAHCSSVLFADPRRPRFGALPLHHQHHPPPHQDAGPSRSLMISTTSFSSSSPPAPPTPAPAAFDDSSDVRHGRRARKNYKNMTRERRVEANARERSRVHTISAAFESLRRAVPSYSYNQRLSKLAILRIASSYITALSRLADLDYSVDQSKPSFADCVDVCTKTIQAEGRAKRRH